MKKALILLVLLVVVVPAAAVLSDAALQNTTVVTHRFPGPIDTIVVRADSGGGDVELVPARGLSVTVRETQRYLLKRPQLQRDVKGGVLTLKASCEHAFVTCATDLRVSVPAGATVTVDGGAGDVDARRIDAGVLALRSGAGDQRLELTGRTRHVRARTGAGDIDIRAHDARRIDAQAGAGDVVVAANTPPREIRSVTGSGDVRIVVPAGAYAVSGKTASGAATIDGITRNDRAPRSIDARSDSGDVTLNGQ